MSAYISVQKGNFNPAQIYKARVLKRLSTKQLAELAGVSQPSITQWENGNRMPSASSIGKLAKSLEIPVEFFFQGATDGQTTDSL